MIAVLISANTLVNSPAAGSLVDARNDDRPQQHAKFLRDSRVSVEVEG